MTTTKHTRRGFLAAGYSKQQAQRAKKRLGVVAEKSGMDGPWRWRLPTAESSDTVRREYTPPEGTGGAIPGTFGPPVRSSNEAITESDPGICVTNAACDTCGQPLLLTRPGRTTCERCRLAGATP